MEFFDFLRTMPGAEFLALYFVWFVLLYGAVLVLRKWGYDSPLTTAVAVILFEGLGVARLVVGYQHGMTKWGGLWIMMVLGFLIFLARFGDSNGNRFQFESGGGCGSDGGCGGGGCGGCGGS